MDIFKGKKLVLLGDEAGVSVSAMRAVFAGSGAEVVYAAIECFV